MAISQNLRFSTKVEPDTEIDHPAGEGLMRRLIADLNSSDWKTDPMDNWRDCGWTTTCHLGSERLEVVISKISNQEWMLQISPKELPGLFGRLVGRKPSGTANSVHDLAVTIHESLTRLGFLGTSRWRWDGFPEDTNSTPEPEMAQPDV